MKRFKIALIQNNANADWVSNLNKFSSLVCRALKKKPDLIASPEFFYYRGPSKNYAYLAEEMTPQVIQDYSKLAKENGTAILLGSLLEVSPVKGKFYNTSVLISEKGRIAAKYRKIHLFDSNIRGASVKESKHQLRGNQPVSATVKGIKMGLSVCYDLRFPELYRALAQKGCLIAFVPANFTEKTGAAHWDVLLRARAIENQMFILAPGQVGTHPSTKIKGYGNSLAVDPWGTVLARGAKTSSDILYAALDLQAQKTLRKRFSVLRHRVLQS